VFEKLKRAKVQLPYFPDIFCLIRAEEPTTTMQADIIRMISGARIIESGSHSQLLAYHGKYAQSWRQRVRLAEMEQRDRNYYDLSTRSGFKI
jgi:hypothetical protein